MNIKETLTLMVPQADILDCVHEALEKKGYEVQTRGKLRLVRAEATHGVPLDDSEKLAAWLTFRAGAIEGNPEDLRSCLELIVAAARREADESTINLVGVAVERVKRKRLKAADAAPGAAEGDGAAAAEATINTPDKEPAP